MSVNSSSSLSLHPAFFKCANSTVGLYIFTAYMCTSVLLIPLFALVLYVGYQRWRRQRSASHSDIFTYHTVVMELISVLGSMFYCCGHYMNEPIIIIVGVFAYSIILPGQMIFHCLTCVERYLAVVHPIIYLGLRKAGGVKLRNISIGCAWVLSFGWLGVTAHYNPELPTIPLVCLFTFFFLLICFCSLSVLCALVRPGPGDVGKEKRRVDQSKQRAFHTIATIMGMLLSKCVTTLLCITMESWPLLSDTDYCVILMLSLWPSLPSGLVLPLLFLHRAGRLPCCKHNVSE